MAGGGGIAKEVAAEAERKLREIRREISESLVHLPAWDADHVKDLIDKLEEIVEARTVARLAGKGGAP